jgi:hypothetical protein
MAELLKPILISASIEDPIQLVQLLQMNKLMVISVLTSSSVQ